MADTTEGMIRGALLRCVSIVMAEWMGCRKRTGWASALIFGLSTLHSSVACAAQVWTYTTAINNVGTIAGYWTDSISDHGFIYDHGKFLDLVDTSGGSQLQPDAINNNGVVAGTMFGGSEGFRGFTFDAGNLAVVSIGSDFTTVYGLNDQGWLVGVYGDISGGSEGYLDVAGTITDIAVPGSLYTRPLSVNDVGTVAGFYVDANGPHGFLLNGGTYEVVDHPGAANYTMITGINNLGEAVGSYLQPGGGYHAFSYLNGSFSSADDPAAQETDPLGINDNGEITGIVLGGTNRQGYVDVGGQFTTIDYARGVGVPEPATWSITVLAVALVGAVLRRRTKIDSPALSDVRRSRS